MGSRTQSLAALQRMLEEQGIDEAPHDFDSALDGVALPGSRAEPSFALTVGEPVVTERIPMPSEPPMVAAEMPPEQVEAVNKFAADRVAAKPAAAEQGAPVVSPEERMRLAMEMAESDSLGKRGWAKLRAAGRGIGRAIARQGPDDNYLKGELAEAERPIQKLKEMQGLERKGLADTADREQKVREFTLAQLGKQAQLEETKRDNDRADKSLALQSEDKDLNRKRLELEFAAKRGDQAAERALRRLDLETRRSDRERDHADKAELKLGQTQDREVQALEKRIPAEASGLSAKLKRLDAYLDDPKYKDDLPGVGPGTNLLPDFAVSGEGQELRQTAIGLVDDLLKMQSGAGVSNLEREKKYAQYGMARGSPEKMFRVGTKNLRSDLAAELRKRQAGFSPESLTEYKKRGGFTADDVGGGSGGPVTMRFPDGSTHQVSPEKVDAARRKGGQEVR